MRLINTHTHQLTDFLWEEHPQYAILSHTWGASEVSFKDFVTRPVSELREMHGYTKIVNTCKHARQEGYDYAWVDTCCIDKSSSAELSEAINSMFKWYGDAAICFAYLSDVTRESFDQEVGEFYHENKEPLEHEESILGSEFGRSRWFTRGWTLQELIAPQRVRFYDRQWNQCAEKNSYSGVLSIITGIEKDLLRGLTRLKDHCVAEKMSWAAKRQTTRLEDAAYSLLGIFEINMPMLYGEGERAFVRLQQQLINTTYDYSIFAWGEVRAPGPMMPAVTDSSRSWPLLAESPADFAACGKVRSLELERGHRREFRLTNAGLHISLPIIEEPGTKYMLGILACAYEDDFRGPLAIRLTPEISDGVYEPASRGDRLYLPPLEQAFSANPRQITIHFEYQRRAEPSGLGAMVFRPMKFWVRFSSESQAFIHPPIQYSYPKRCWNHHSNTFSLPLAIKQKAAVSFHYHTDIWLAFGTMPNSRRWIHISPRKDGTTLEEFCQEPRAYRWRQGSWLTVDGSDLLEGVDPVGDVSSFEIPDLDIRVTARIHQETIMDQKLNAIDVSFASQGATSSDDLGSP